MSQRAKYLLPVAVIAAGILLAAMIVAARPEVERVQSPAPPPLVRVIEAQRSDLRLSVGSQGTVRPRTESELVAQVAGQVDWVSPHFAAGAFFRKGSVLLRIDPRDFELAVEQAEARVAQARVRLDLEEAESEIAREEWADLGQGDPTPLVLREPQLAEARAELQGAEAALEKARLDLERARVTAPFDGRIVEKRADVGQFVGRGNPLAVLYATDVAEVELPVTRADLDFLDLDLGANGGPNEGPEVVLSATLTGQARTWSARIVRTASTFDPQTRMLSLWAEIDDPFARRRDAEHSALPMGLFVEAQIEGIEAPNVVALPREAVRDGGRVYVVDGEARLRFREVTLLRYDGEQAILTVGVEAGDLVCVSSLEAAVDGMEVRTVRESSEEA